MRPSYQNARTRAIDKLGWPFTAVMKSYGVRVGLRANQEHLLTQMKSLLPPGATEDGAEQPVLGVFSVGHSVGSYHLYNRGRELASALTQDEIAERFEAKCRLFIAEHSPERLFVHAGVVRWRDKCIVIPGRSFSGKTTLVKELLRDGAIYYSDEYAILDEEGFVHPFATPLGVREVGGVSQTKQEALGLGACVGEARVRVDLVICASYKKGATTSLQEVGVGRGILLLLANTVSARRAPQRALSILKAALQTAAIYKGVRGEAKEALARLPVQGRIERQRD